VDDIFSFQNGFKIDALSKSHLCFYISYLEYPSKPEGTITEWEVSTSGVRRWC